MSIQALSYVIEHCEATLGARCLMFAIANHADERGENCWASVKTLAHEARISRTATQQALRRLEADEEIEASGVSDFGTTIYRISGMQGGQVALPPQASNGGPRNLAGGPSCGAGGAKKTPSEGQVTWPKPSFKPSTKPTTPIPTSGELIFLPVRPEGGRRRDRLAYREERAEVVNRIAAHFPDTLLEHVDHAVGMYWMAHRNEALTKPLEVDLDEIADRLETFRPSAAEEAAA